MHLFDYPISESRQRVETGVATPLIRSVSREIKWVNGPRSTRASPTFLRVHETFLSSASSACACAFAALARGRGHAMPRIRASLRVGIREPLWRIPVLAATRVLSQPNAPLNTAELILTFG